MKLFLISLLLLFYTLSVTIAQTPPAIDSLSRLLSETKKDTSRVNLLIQLARNYFNFKADSALILSKQAIQLSEKINFKQGESIALNEHGREFRYQGKYPEALEAHFKALQISKGYFYSDEALSLMLIGNVYREISEYGQSLGYYDQAKKIFESHSDTGMVIQTLSNIGEAYEQMNRLASALFSLEQAYTLSVKLHQNNGQLLTRLGNVQARLGNYQKAISYYHDVLRLSALEGDGKEPIAQYKMADAYLQLQQVDSSLYYAKQAFLNSRSISYRRGVLDASLLLAKLHKSRNRLDSAYYYLDISGSTKDSMFGAGKFHQLQLLTINEKQRQQEILQHQKELEQEQERYKNKIRWYASVASLAVFLLLAIILFRNNRAKQKANELLQSQKNEVEKQRTVVEKALENLKTTQSQLIQSEKMASLGELTAGIAHEIQNPLNFVNNFSDVNTELLGELKNELTANNKDEALALAEDIIENEQKINHHGKRADAIVKGMLQHSRASSGKKELTDINALADEYLRLSYHGLRAKDKDFNATIETNFDESIGKIEVVPQDIGRVLLNLYNNAFYAVNEKKKTTAVKGENYEPTVWVDTKCIKSASGAGGLEISVKDNGYGIPQKVVDKIFQPFFTTKPTGAGTGLGLSLSYDIIKACGGEIKVESKEGDGAEFIIELPSKSH